MKRKTTIWGITWALLGLALAGPLAAQTRLFVQEPDGKFHAVVKVSGSRPFIMENGKEAAAKGQRLALKKVEEYLPIFVAVRNKDARPTNVSVDYAAAPANNSVHFSAKFESADLLTEVFLVLEMQIPNVGKKIFIYEVGQLNPRTPRVFSADLALGQYLGTGQVDLHLFVSGSEVFTSELPLAVRDELLGQMIAKRIAGVTQAGLKPFFGSAPAYPAALRKSGLTGEAVVSLRVTAQGTVLDPVVERASEPAFGEETLVAVQQWRFIPRVVDGRAVETKVSIPFAFDPPKAKGGEEG